MCILNQPSDSFAGFLSHGYHSPKASGISPGNLSRGLSQKVGVMWLRLPTRDQSSGAMVEGCRRMSKDSGGWCGDGSKNLWALGQLQRLVVDVQGIRIWTFSTHTVILHVSFCYCSCWEVLIGALAIFNLRWFSEQSVVLRIQSAFWAAAWERTWKKWKMQKTSLQRRPVNIRKVAFGGWHGIAT